MNGENYLTTLPLLVISQMFPIVCASVFDMGVHTPPLQTYTPPNHNSALSYPDHVLSHIQKELSLRRYSSPFSRSRLHLIGPFHMSPLGTVPKSHGYTEHRIVQDLSFPRNDPTQSSVNDQIDIEDFRCDWGTFNDVHAIVIDTPKGAEARGNLGHRFCLSVLSNTSFSAVQLHHLLEWSLLHRS